MDKDSRRRQRRDNVISSLNVALDGLNLTKEILSITPAKAVCGSVSVVLAMIRVRLPGPRRSLRAKWRSGFDDKRGGLCRAWALLR